MNTSSFSAQKRLNRVVSHLSAGNVPSSEHIEHVSNADEKKREKEIFKSFYPELRKFVLQDLDKHEQPEYAKKWIARLMDLSIPGGKMNRGLTVVHTAKLLKHPLKLTKEEFIKASILGWCIEILQAFFLVADDLMDGSITRRGNACWYRQPHLLDRTGKEKVGLIAVNDSFILEGIIYRILRRFLRDEKNYAGILDGFLETSYQTELGQLLDLTSQPPGGVVDLNMMTIDRYRKIVKYKTAYYSFYLPVVLGLQLTDKASPNALKEAESILIPMGEYFQIQDDYLDCFGDPKVIGKVGRDIEENKCGWLIVTALPLCSQEQRKLLEKHYGRDNPSDVKVVKKIYHDLNLQQVFHKFEEKSFAEMKALIEQSRFVPKNVYTDLLKRIYKRSL